MIFMLSDYGLDGPYVGQVEAALARAAPGEERISLFHDLPPFRADLAAYLLPAYSAETQPEGSIFLCVVDPGVGSSRRAIALEADGRWYVGPDNGLFAIVARRAKSTHWWVVSVPGQAASASFHGRDIFAPAAARIARGEMPAAELGDASCEGEDWPDDLAKIVYADRFGNLMTGIRAAMLGQGSTLTLNGRALDRATTFSDVRPGEAFWYENGNGLAEIAVNQGSASVEFKACVGNAVEVLQRGGMGVGE
jgi:hypothetical protein